MYEIGEIMKKCKYCGRIMTIGAISVNQLFYNLDNEGKEVACFNCYRKERKEIANEEEL